MRRFAWFSLALVSCSGLLAAETPGAARPLTLTLTTEGLMASGVEPGGQVAWFGVEREVDPDFSSTRRSREGVVLAGTDGVARIDLKPPPASRALWVVVELASGAFAAGAPEGYVLNVLGPDKVPCRGEVRDGVDEGDVLVDQRSQIEGLMVRPTVGIWRFSGGDGGPDDEDKEHDGRLRMALAAFRPLGISPKAPSKIEGRDLWFVIDPMAMDLSVLQGGVAR